MCCIELLVCVNLFLDDVANDSLIKWVYVSVVNSYFFGGVYNIDIYNTMYTHPDVYVLCSVLLCFLAV